MTISPAVYKLRYNGRNYYRLGLYPEDARKNLAKEKRVDKEKVEILDEGRKQ